MDVSKKNRFVLLAERVEKSVSLPAAADGFKLFIEKDVMAKCLSLMKEHQTKHLQILFFLSAKDFTKVNTYFKRFEPKGMSYRCVVFECDDCMVKEYSAEDSVLTLRTKEISRQEFQFLLRRGFRELDALLNKKREEKKQVLRLMDAWNDQEALIHIGRSLSIEKDPDKLLRTILHFSKKITGADAGSIFIVEGEEENKFLRFKYSHTFSKELSYEEFTMPMETNSIAGYVAVTGQVLNIPDVYELNADAPVSFNPTFDKEHGYRTKSMLVLPMRNHIDEIIGVIQLINSKEVGDVQTGNEAFEVILETDEDFELKVCPFDERYESLMEAVASQAAIALENNRMILQIEHQFEEFVKASVSAIESRDPATSGHSFRIAEMCVRAAKAINAKNEGPFAGIFYSKPPLKEIEFAGLLHDFGKVYIDPSIFLKEKKLFSRDFEYLMMRLNFLYRSLELKFDREHIGPDERAEKLGKIKEIMEQVTVLNEPKVQNTDPSEVIDSILALQDELEVEDLKGTDIPILEDKEMTNLKIKRGSLNDEERRIIQSHVEHTYTFVSKIPWPDEYRNIPDIARKHHEKLDGTGYPLGINDVEKLPIASRIMAIADIFDALSATDRPYKRAVPREKIFSILREEAEAGKLDHDLVELFIESRAWDLGSRK